MKKLLVILVLLCTFGGLLFADDFTSCLNNIDKKLDSTTIATIQKYSANLTEAEKYVLYEHNQMSGGNAAFINLCLGFGIGSYIQGDTTGGTISLVADLAGYAMILAGNYKQSADKKKENERQAALAAEQEARYNSGDYSYTSSSSSSSSSTNTGFPVLSTIGLVVIAANRIFTCIRPYTYARSYNKRLSKALYGAPTVALVPTLDELGNTSWTLSAKIDL